MTSIPVIDSCDHEPMNLRAVRWMPLVIPEWWRRNHQFRSQTIPPMLRGLPDRPLYDHEVDALIDSDALRLAFPAMPQSLRYDETDLRSVLVSR